MAFIAVLGQHLTSLLHTPLAVGLLANEFLENILYTPGRFYVQQPHGKNREVYLWMQLFS